MCAMSSDHGFVESDSLSIHKTVARYTDANYPGTAVKEYSGFHCTIILGEGKSFEGATI